MCGQEDSIAHRVAGLICAHETEVKDLILGAYDWRYVHSKGYTLPQETRDAWTKSIIGEIVGALRSRPNPRSFEMCGGDMVLQCEKSLNSFVTYLENELFSARVIGAFLWRHWVGDPAAVKAGVGALEASIRASIEANTAVFVHELCAPGTLSTILSLQTPSGPDFEAAPLRASESEEPAHPPVHPELTQRESEILVLVIEGLSNKEIAARLEIGLSTVKHHVSSIFNRYAVQSRTELVALALKEPPKASR